MSSKSTIVIDIGNSSVMMAPVVNGTIGTVLTCTHHELEGQLKTMQVTYGEGHCVVSSVVPDLDPLIRQHWVGQVQFITHKTIPRLKINLEKPEDVGADRLVAALAAWEEVGDQCLVVDAGTAITVCYVTKEGVYEGGMIVPGMAISSKSLNDYTAKIPLIWVEPEANIVGKTTEKAVKMGLFHGYKHMINGLISDYKHQFGDLKVIGTGHGLEVFGKDVQIDYFDPLLTLKGLASATKSFE